MQTINTGLTLRGLNGKFFPSLQQTVAMWRQICTVVPSDGKQEDYGWIGQLPGPREWKGERQTKPMRNFNYSIVNKTWEMTDDIDRDEFEDDQTGQLGKRAAEMGKRFARHPDAVLTQLRVAGLGATMGLAYDAQYFYDTDHSEGDSGAQSNLLTLDIAGTPANPTSLEIKAAFQLGVQALMGYKDDQGESINDAYGDEGMTGLIMTVPVNMYWNAVEALSVPILNNTGNVIARKAKVLAVPKLTATDRLYIDKVDDEVGPFIFQQRRPVQTEIIDDRNKKYVRYAADGRYNMGFGLWQKSVSIQLT